MEPPHTYSWDLEITSINSVHFSLDSDTTDDEVLYEADIDTLTSNIMGICHDLAILDDTDPPGVGGPRLTWDTTMSDGYVTDDQMDLIVRQVKDIVGPDFDRAIAAYETWRDAQ